MIGRAAKNVVVFTNKSTIFRGTSDKLVVEINVSSDHLLEISGPIIKVFHAKLGFLRRVDKDDYRKNISSVSQLRSNGVFTQKLNVEIERIDQQSEHLAIEMHRLTAELMRLDAKKQKIEDKIAFEQRILIA